MPATIPGTPATVSNTTALCPYLFAKNVSANHRSRMVNQNAEDEVFQDFKYWEDQSDQFRDGEGSLSIVEQNAQVRYLSFHWKIRELVARMAEDAVIAADDHFQLLRMRLRDELRQAGELWEQRWGVDAAADLADGALRRYLGPEPGTAAAEAAEAAAPHRPRLRRPCGGSHRPPRLPRYPARSDRGRGPPTPFCVAPAAQARPS